MLTGVEGRLQTGVEGMCHENQCWSDVLPCTLVLKGCAISLIGVEGCVIKQAGV
jgi:hypothetical protein